MWHTGLLSPLHVGSSWLRGGTRVSCIGGHILYHWENDLYVLPSRFEGYPTITIESLISGTPVLALEVAGVKDQIDEDVKEEREAKLMELQKDISSEISASLIGMELTALIEGRIPEEEEEEGVMVYSARTWRDAPDIDGFIFITSDRELNSGDMVRCRVVGSYEYDLIGELV